MDEERMKRLQDHLALIRACAGWSSTDLGNRLGVTRQMISNLETSKTYTMTKMQYLAIRKVLDDEIRSSPEEETQMLRDILEILVDHPENYSEEVRGKILENAKLLAPAAAAKDSDRRNISLAWGAVAGIAAAAIGIGIEILTSTDNKNEN